MTPVGKLLSARRWSKLGFDRSAEQQRSLILSGCVRLHSAAAVIRRHLLAFMSPMIRSV